MMCHLPAICFSIALGVPCRGPVFQLKMLMRVCSKSKSPADLSKLVHVFGASSRLSLATEKLGNRLPRLVMCSRRTVFWSQSLSRRSESVRNFLHRTAAASTCEVLVQIEQLHLMKLVTLHTRASAILGCRGYGSEGGGAGGTLISSCHSCSDCQGSCF